MTIAYQDVATSTLATTATSMTVNMPSSVPDGELLFMWFYCTLNTTVTISGGGWNSALSTNNGTQGRMTILWRVASSEPASYTANFSQSTRVIVHVTRHSDVATDQPISDSAITAISGTSALTTAARGGKRQGSWIFTAVGCRTSPDPGSSFTTNDGLDAERADATTTGGTSDNRPSLAVYDSNRIIGVGSTSTRTFTASGSRVSGSGIVAILEIAPDDPVTSSDTGSGNDGGESVVVPVSDGDTGSGAEANSDPALQSDDVSTSLEEGSTTSTLSGTDTGAFLDEEDVDDGGSKGSGDTASSAESALIEIVSGDTGVTVDSDVLNTTSFDIGTAVDTEQRDAVSDALAIWLPSVNAPPDSSYFAYGSVPQGSSRDKTFRVKNISLTSKAVGVTVSLTGSGSGSANPANLHLLSKDGVRFTASINLGTLAPGATSEVITLRQVIPQALSLGVKQFNLVLTASSWAVEFWPSYVLSLQIASIETGSFSESESVEEL